MNDAKPRKTHMFSKIFDFAYRRTGLQAFGFYLAQLIVYLLIVGVALGFFMGAGAMPEDFEGKIDQMRIFGPIIGLSYGGVLGWFMVKAKGGVKSGRVNMLIGALAAALGALGGPMLALIPVSYLSTKPVGPMIEAPIEPSEPTPQ